MATSSSDQALIMLSEFIKYLNTGDFISALGMCDPILSIEPNNKLILEYKAILPQKIMQEEEEDSDEESFSEEDEEGSDEGAADEGATFDDQSTKCSVNTNLTN